MTRWPKEEKLCETKYFRKGDRASHKNLSEDDIFDIRDTIVAGSSILRRIMNLEDLREDDPVLSMLYQGARELEIGLQRRLCMMKESIGWCLPKSTLFSFCLARIALSLFVRVR